MTEEEIHERYWKWENDSSKQTLSYLEEWEQWHYSIKLYDNELYEAIVKKRKELGVENKTNAVGLPFLFKK